MFGNKTSLCPTHIRIPNMSKSYNIKHKHKCAILELCLKNINNYTHATVLTFERVKQFVGLWTNSNGKISLSE